MEYIKWKHYKKLLSTQKFLIWNNIDSNNEGDIENGSDEDSYWDLSTINQWEKQNDVVELYSQVQVKTFNLVQQKHIEWLKKNMGSKTIRVIDIQIEDAIKTTKQHIDSGEYDFIIDPVFAVDYNIEGSEYQAVSCPAGYDIKNKIIYDLKISTKNTSEDFMRQTWNHMIICKNVGEINDIIINHLDMSGLKAKYIGFISSNKCNIVASGRSDSIFKQYPTWEFITNNVLEKTISEVQDLKVGMGFKKGTKKTNFEQYPYESTIIESIISNKISLLLSKKKRTTNARSYYSLDEAIQKIVKAKEVKKLGPLCEDDIQPFIQNPLRNQILESMDYPLKGFSGKLIPMLSHLEIFDKEIKLGSGESNGGYDVSNKTKGVMESSLVMDSIEEKSTVEFTETDITLINRFLHDLKSDVTWYDFEGFSMPYPIVDNSLPYYQLPFQVSIIRTENDKEIGEPINYVADPKVININSLKEIINLIYKKGNFYVVYNKGYENSRLREIMMYVKLDESTREDEYNELSRKTKEIIDNTIDLADLFVVHSSNSEKKPPIFIPWLKGRYSIKMIEKYISTFYKASPNIRHIKEYKNLDIQNGLMAMEKAIERHTGITGDESWIQTLDKLKEYCENDVRAMIMVYDLVKDLVKNEKS